MKGGHKSKYIVYWFRRVCFPNTQICVFWSRYDIFCVSTVSNHCHSGEERREKGGNSFIFCYSLFSRRFLSFRPLKKKCAPPLHSLSVEHFTTSSFINHEYSHSPIVWSSAEFSSRWAIIYIKTRHFLFFIILRRGEYKKKFETKKEETRNQLDLLKFEFSCNIHCWNVIFMDQNCFF